MSCLLCVCVRVCVCVCVRHLFLNTPHGVGVQGHAQRRYAGLRVHGAGHRVQDPCDLSNLYLSYDAGRAGIITRRPPRLKS